MKKRVLVLINLMLIIFALAGCSTKGAYVRNDTAEAVNIEDMVAIDDELATDKIQIAGWAIEVLDYKIVDSLENVSVVLGYADTATNTYIKEAEEGNEFCLIKLNIEKIDSMEEIIWDKFLLFGDLDKSYVRINDTFLSDLGMKRMPGTNLNFGMNEGWVAFELKKGHEKISLNYEFENESYNYHLLGEEDELITNNSKLPVYEDYLKDQKKVDEDLLAEVEKGYTIDSPFVVVNPYGRSPLSAIVIFDTDIETNISLTVKGKNKNDDISTTFLKGKSHIIPIYGLYPGDTTEIVLSLDDGTQKTLNIATDQLSEDLVSAKVTAIEQSDYDFEKLIFASVSGDEYGIIAFDSAGDIRLVLEGGSMPFPIKRLRNGNVMVTSSRLLAAPYHNSGLLEIDLCGKVYNDYLIPGGNHHDFVELDNGNLLIAGNPIDFLTVEDHIYEIDRASGKIVYEIDLATVLDSSDGGSINRSDEDWFHNNGIWYDESTDNILLSGRHVDSIVAINKTNKEISWILGDPKGWKNVDKKLFFTPIGEGFEWHYAQHEVTILPNGNVMMFDNGAGRTKEEYEDNKVTGDNVYSRAVIYSIDTDTMTIEQVWQYGKERGSKWYSSFISGSEYLSDNNIWITSGGVLYNPETKSYDLLPNNSTGMENFAYLNQVKDGKLVFEMILDRLTYRSSRLTPYTDKNQLDISQEGKFLGNLGKTPTIQISDINMEEVINPDFDIQIIQNPDRFIVKGKWEKADDDGAVILRRNDGILIGYSIPATDEKIETTDLMEFNIWFSPIGLENYSYDIYIRNKGQIYNTNYKIEL